MPLITSRAHPFFKQLIKLGKSTRTRKKTGQTLLDGLHLIQAYHTALGLPESLIICQSAQECSEIKDFLKKIKKYPTINIATLSDSLYQKVSPVKTPTGIMARINIPKLKTIATNRTIPFCVMLEAIQDPGNLGSILRSAAAAGASEIYLSHDCTDAWAPKTLRAAMGAHFLLRIYERSNLLAVAQQFKGQLITTSPQARKSLYQTQLTGPVAFIFGNEGTGLSDEVFRLANEQITIPMPGKTESLNAAAAAAVCFFERVRQCMIASTDSAT
tara:strand:+ start:2650 stop:3465 length:816 start_codon:yes stop_codon:yes gene_type:complete